MKFSLVFLMMLDLKYFSYFQNVNASVFVPNVNAPAFIPTFALPPAAPEPQQPQTGESGYGTAIIAMAYFECRKAFSDEQNLLV